jgi:hypothetical protein
MIIFFFGLGVGGTYPVVAAESSSVRLRAKTNNLGFVMNGFVSCAFGFFIPYLYNVHKGNAKWGGKVGFFFSGISLVAVLIIYLEFPEMKNRSYGELDEMFGLGLKTRAFKKYVAEDPQPQMSSSSVRSNWSYFAYFGMLSLLHKLNTCGFQSYDEAL